MGMVSYRIEPLSLDEGTLCLAKPKLGPKWASGEPVEELVDRWGHSPMIARVLGLWLERHDQPRYQIEYDARPGEQAKYHKPDPPDRGVSVSVFSQPAQDARQGVVGSRTIEPFVCVHSHSIDDC
jgi:hypothetical protein